LIACGESIESEKTQAPTAAEPHPSSEAAADTPRIDTTTQAPAQAPESAVTTSEPNIVEIEITNDNFPRIDGSTATIPLGEAVAAALLGLPRSEAAAYAVFSGTNEAFLRLVGGSADLLIVYDPPQDTLDEYGEELNIVPIGCDALVFLVNAANPVSNLTSEQILDIYTGKITNWSEIGGEDGEILPYQRNETSGSQAWFRRLVAGERELAPAPAGLIYSDMSGLLAAIAAYDNGPYAVGYNMYYYVTQMKNDSNIKILTVEGIAPSDETIASGRYPYVGQFYTVIRKDTASDTAAYAIFNWLQTAEAAALMKSEGYIPLNDAG